MKSKKIVQSGVCDDAGVLIWESPTERPGVNNRNRKRTRKRKANVAGVGG